MRKYLALLALSVAALPAHSAGPYHAIVDAAHPRVLMPFCADAGKCLSGTVDTSRFTLGACYWRRLQGPFYSTALGSGVFSFTASSAAIINLDAEGYWQARVIGPSQSEGTPSGEVECVRYAQIFGEATQPATCTATEIVLSDLWADATSQTAKVEDNALAALTRISGNLAQVPGDISGTVDILLHTPLVLHHSIAPPPPHAADRAVVGTVASHCPGRYLHIVGPSGTPGMDTFTTSTAQLAPADSAKSTRCFLTTIGGNWASPGHGGSGFAQASIDEHTDGSMWLNVIPVLPKDPKNQVTAGARCIKLAIPFS